MKLFLYPIYGLASAWDGEPFDREVLPIRICDDVFLEDVTPLLSESTFGPIDSLFGRSDAKTLNGFRYALVRRFEESTSAILAENDLAHVREEELARIAACLRLIRPMHEELGPMRGTLRQGRLVIDSFSRPYQLDNLSEVEEYGAVRNQDVQRLINLAPKMLTAMAGDYWKFRMAVHFYTDGFFAGHNWKTRFFYRCTALEAIFNSEKHRRSAISKARIRAFLGEDTPLYAPNDIPDWLPQAEDLTVNKVLDPLYDARNTIAHGNRLPDHFFNEIWRTGRNGSLNKLAVLDETVLLTGSAEYIEDSRIRPSERVQQYRRYRFVFCKCRYRDSSRLEAKEGSEHIIRGTMVASLTPSAPARDRRCGSRRLG